MSGLIAMGRIKTTASVLFALVAWLLFLSAPNFYQDATSPVSTPAANRALPPINRQLTLFRFETEQPCVTEFHAPPPIKRALPNPAHSQAVAQSTDGSLEFTSELALIAELENQPADTALIELLPMLYDDVQEVRLAAIQSLGDMTTPAAVPALLAALGDPDPQLRIAVLEALAAHEDASTVISIEPYLIDQDRNVRLAAIEALADIENETAVYALAGLLSDRDPVIRRRAVHALDEIGSETAMMYLLQARYDTDEEIRVSAEAILMELEYEAVN